MPDQDFRNSRTSDPSSSIWHNITEETFRQHIVDLERCTNAVPIGPQTFPIAESDASAPDGTQLLPLAVEQQLVNDFAAIAAVEEGAQSVSAVCIEQHPNQSGITVCFAAVDTINESVQHTLKGVANILTKTTTTSAPKDHSVLRDQLFSLFVQQHHRRILGRLRSTKWQKPIYLSRSHKKPLWQDFANLLHRASFLYTKRETSLRQTLETEIQTLALLYSNFETTPSITLEEELSLLQCLILSTHRFCLNPTVRTYTHRLTTFSLSSSKPTPQISSALKTLHQLEKIAAYSRISNTLISTSILHPNIFKSITLTYLPPYTSISTNIAYEPWAKTTHVHAEVQLAVYYDLQPQSTSPTQPRKRIIGTSKHLCYLCYLFLTHHSAFLVSNTHGRLYDQWTIPDLSSFDQQTVNRYRGIIQRMDTEVRGVIRDVEREVGDEVEQVKGKGKGRWRVEPMTSREDLLLRDLEDGGDGIEDVDLMTRVGLVERTLG